MPGDGLFASLPEKVYLGLGLLIGLVAGPLQASSRSLLARIAPPARIGEFFGLGASGLISGDLAALMVARHDAGMLAELAEVDPSALKIRERIARGVKVRLDVAARDEAAVRRWIGFLALPHNLPLALALGWRSADVVWRWAGDTATDENHYSKRALLGAILVSALAVRLARGRSEAEAYVDARIADVMAFEKWKAGLRPFDLAREVTTALARIRYRAFT